MANKPHPRGDVLARFGAPRQFSSTSTPAVEKIGSESQAPAAVASEPMQPALNPISEAKKKAPAKKAAAVKKEAPKKEAPKPSTVEPDDDAESTEAMKAYKKKQEDARINADIAEYKRKKAVQALAAKRK